MRTLFISIALMVSINGCNKVDIYLDPPAGTDHTEERTDDSRHTIESSGVRSWQYFLEGDYENSLEILYLLLELVETQDLSKIADYYNRLSLLHSRLGNNKQAEHYLRKSLEIMQIDTDVSMRIRAMRNFVVLHASYGDENVPDAKTTIYNSLLIKQQHESEKKNELLVQKTEEIQRKWNIIVLLIIIIVLIMLTTIVIIFLYQSLKQAEALKKQEAAITVRHYEELLKYKKEAKKQHGNSEKNDEKTDESKQLASDIQELFETKKIYRQQGLSVDDAAKRLQISSRQLSNAISLHYHKSFTEYVNTFRVEEAIEMLKSQVDGGEYANYTIQAVGEEVGFNSRSSFYRAFNQIVGVTPSEYIDNINTTKNDTIEPENEHIEQESP